MSDEENKDEVVAEATEVAEAETTEVPVEEVKEEVPAKEEKVEEKKAEVKEEKKAPSGKFKDLIKQIEELSVLELSELVKELEERFGVSAAAPVAMAGAAVAGGGAAEAEEEKSEYDLILASSGDKKIQVIKAVREIKPELGLKEAKDLVDAAPKEIAKGMKKEDAEAAKKKLVEAGATVELK
jgi:large subunit ribosomal protein L7/L12